MKFSDDDWNKLIEYFSQAKVRKLLYSESRDNIIKMVIKILITEPKLLRFAKIP